MQRTTSPPRTRQHNGTEKHANGLATTGTLIDRRRRGSDHHLTGRAGAATTAASGT